MTPKGGRRILLSALSHALFDRPADMAPKRQRTQRGAAAHSQQPQAGQAAAPALDVAALPSYNDLLGSGMVVTDMAADDRKQKSINRLLSILPLPDGRLCIVCKAADTTTDPVYTERTLVWAYPPGDNRRNVGQAIG